jgi:TolA-binding protein
MTLSRGASPALLALLMLLAWAPAPARSAPAPQRGAPTQTPSIQGRTAVPGQPPTQDVEDPTNEDFYRAIIRATAAHSPADTLGNGLFYVARSEFYACRLDDANRHCQDFTKSYTRNLNVDDALEIILLIRDFRDFEDVPLCSYARALAYRAAGASDSAAAAARVALERFPGAAVRYHLEFQLAELASERGDHQAALRYALAVADTSSKSRLSPEALRLAGDETLASGQSGQAALKYYQALLERYPNSPLAPEVRAQVIDMRKRLQL